MSTEITGQISNGVESIRAVRPSISKTSNPVQLDEPSRIDVQPKEEVSFFRRSVRSVFGFRKTSLTLFVLLTYVLVIILVSIAKHSSLSIPSKETHILETSWLDLQEISNQPHPYVSHANDHVHDYILSRVNEIASTSKFITISDDSKEKLHMFEIIKSWFNSSSEYAPLHYFESSNILVKIEGQDPKLDGLLLSSHFDSVPTAYGTTDDGTGVASMLGVLEHYAKSGVRPIRTIVFNFNNNEEFGLFGAEAFMSHPWKDLVKYFINLEGTGTGERAVLFRTSDYEIGQFYQDVRSPFGSSIFQQGFASGLVHSETDFRVYVKNGLRGLDIAFYKPRSLYHTAKDSIRFSSKNALWHMLSNTLDLTTAIANAKVISEDTGAQSVYFDILSYYFVIIPLDSLVIANMALLTIIPIVLIIFGIVIHRRKIWDVGFSWVRILLSVFLAALATKMLADTIYLLNPFIVSRDFYSPLIALSSTFLFINYILLTLSDNIWPIHDFKLVITLEFFVALWIILLYSTIQQNQSTVYTGQYLISIIYSLYSVSVFLGLFSISIASYRKSSSTEYSNYGSIQEPHRARPTFEADEQDETSQLLSNTIPNTETDEEEEEILNHEHKFGHPQHNSFTYDWSLQYLLLVPINFLMTYVSVTLILEGINQTIQESLESNEFVFFVLLVSSILLTIPLVSFSYKLNYLFGMLLVLSIVISTFRSLFAVPFTPESPLKFRFAQTVDLDSSDPIAKVEVFGREGFLSNILQDLPSVKSNKRELTCESQSDGNELCKYDAERPYLMDGTSGDLHSYLTVNVLKSSTEVDQSPYAPLTSELEINAKNNRYCSLSFNSTTYKSGQYGKSPLRIFTYFHDKATNKSTPVTYLDKMATIPSGPSKDTNGNEVYKYISGIDAVNLHRLTWDQETYHVGLQWIPKWLEDGEEQEPADSPDNKLGVTVSCYWGEYDGTSTIDGESKRIIPAYDELLQYTPRSTSFSNRYEGLVRVDRYFTL